MTSNHILINNVDIISVVQIYIKLVIDYSIDIVNGNVIILLTTINKITQLTVITEGSLLARNVIATY